MNTKMPELSEYQDIFSPNFLRLHNRFVRLLVLRTDVTNSCLNLAKCSRHLGPGPKIIMREKLGFFKALVVSNNVLNTCIGPYVSLFKLFFLSN